MESTTAAKYPLVDICQRRLKPRLTTVSVAHVQIDEFVFSTVLQWMRQDGEFLVDKYASAEAPASAGAGPGGKATELASFASAALPNSLGQTFLPAVTGPAAAAGATDFGALQMVADSLTPAVGL